MLKSRGVSEDTKVAGTRVPRVLQQRQCWVRRPEPRTVFKNGGTTRTVSRLDPEGRQSVIKQYSKRLPYFGLFQTFSCHSYLGDAESKKFGELTQIRKRSGRDLITFDGTVHATNNTTASYQIHLGIGIEVPYTWIDQ